MDTFTSGMSSLSTAILPSNSSSALSLMSSSSSSSSSSSEFELSSNTSSGTTAAMASGTTMATSVWPTEEPMADNTETLHLVRYVVQKVCVPVVVALGVLGNSLSMVVLTRKSMKNSTSCYLTALAAFDMVYLVCSLTLSFKHYDLIHRDAVYVHWFRYGRVLSDMAANVSVLLTITFTVERYIGVCHPIKGRLLCTPQRARVVIALVVIVAVACTLPEVFEMEVVWKSDRTNIDTNTNTTTTTTANTTSDNLDHHHHHHHHHHHNHHHHYQRYPTSQYTSFASTYSYQIGYYWFIATLFTFLPLLLLCVFNGLLVASLFRAAQRRTRMTSTTGSWRPQGPAAGSSSTASCPVKIGSSCPFSSSTASSRCSPAGGRRVERCLREQHWITKMLVTVVVVFILCQLPGAILLLFWAYNDLAQVQVSVQGRNQFHMAANVTNLLLQINASINFLLYSVSSSKFRHVFCRTLCLRRCRPPSPARCYRCATVVSHREVPARSLVPTPSKNPPYAACARSGVARATEYQALADVELVEHRQRLRRQSSLLTPERRKEGVNGIAHARRSSNFRDWEDVEVSTLDGCIAPKGGR